MFYNYFVTINFIICIDIHIYSIKMINQIN